MGYMRHHAICISSWNRKELLKVHNKAKKIFNHLATEIVDSTINSESSFFIAPDGSKEGWEESNLYNKKRTDIVDFIEKRKYADGSNCIRYAELFFADDEKNCAIVNHN